jgi:uncharacterized protein YigE (DUF2233 family)
VGWLKTFLDWLDRTVRPAWLRVTIVLVVLGCIGAFQAWKGLPAAAQTQIVDKFTPAPADVKVSGFDLSHTGNVDVHELTWLKGKVERNLVELLNENGHATAHDLSALADGARARLILSGRIEQEEGEDVQISFQLRRASDNRPISSGELSATASMFHQNYKSIPAAMLFALHVSPKSLSPQPSHATAHSLTNTPEAYLLFIEAKRLVGMGDNAGALKRLDGAIGLDPKFASAYWAKSQVLTAAGDGATAQQAVDRARKINPDFARIAFIESRAGVLPDLIGRVSQAKWRAVNADQSTLKVCSAGNVTCLSAWRFDMRSYRLGTALQTNLKGDTASEYRLNERAILAMNGGFFDIAADESLSPSGLLVANGQQLHPWSATAGSGVLLATDERVSVVRAKVAPAPAYKSAVQVGPLVVDPGGHNGIKSDDHQRERRLALCLRGRDFTAVAVDGDGLSLFEFGELLSQPASGGGFGCERALNLDGGPSVQVSYAADADHHDELRGLWRVPDALVVHAIPPRSLWARLTNLL